MRENEGADLNWQRIFLNRSKNAAQGGTDDRRAVKGITSVPKTRPAGAPEDLGWSGRSHFWNMREAEVIVEAEEAIPTARPVSSVSTTTPVIPQDIKERQPVVSDAVPVPRPQQPMDSAAFQGNAYSAVVPQAQSYQTELKSAGSGDNGINKRLIYIIVAAVCVLVLVIVAAVGILIGTRGGGGGGGNSTKAVVSPTSPGAPPPAPVTPPVTAPVAPPQGPTDRGIATTAPTAEPICKMQSDDFLNCATVGQAFSCLACVTNLMDSTTITTCGTLQVEICTPIQQECDCGMCAEEILSFIDCNFEEQCGDESCVLDEAPVSSPVAPPVRTPVAPPVRAPVPANDNTKCKADTELIYQTCLNTMLSGLDANACINCVNTGLNASSSITSCTEYGDTFCPQFLACSVCGSCLESISDWVNCEVVGDNCDVDCTERGGSPVAAPVAAPVADDEPTDSIAPTVVEICPEDFQPYSDCLDTQISQNERNDCIVCTEEAIGTVATSSCLVFTPSWCGRSCASCGVCEPLVDVYINCIYESANNVDCGEIECGRSP